MKLTVTGVEDGQEQFRFLWGVYVRGFKPWKHCKECLRGTSVEGIGPSMGNIEIALPRATDYFYLCGYAKGSAANRGLYNLHLAVEPMPGKTASARSKYGPLFTIEGAREIVIPDSDEPRAAWGEFDYRCKNFRFGKLVYPSDVTGPNAPRIPIMKSR